MEELEAYAARLRAEHERLTAAYLAAQEQAEAAWAAYEAASSALTTFRERYGRVLRALDEGRVVVTD